MTRALPGFVLLAVVCWATSWALAGPVTLYSVSNSDDLLRVIDPASAATISSVPMTATGDTIEGLTGLAVHPATGQLFGVVKLDGVGTRQLRTIDSTTGATIFIGNLSNNIASIAFDSAGTLYGVSGDGGNPAETLYTIHTTTAATALVMSLGNGDDGEAIAYRTTDGRLYHASGLGSQVFESIDLATLQVAPIPLSGAGYEEALAMTHSASLDLLLMGDSANVLHTMTPGGVVAVIGILDHTSKGLAWVEAVVVTGQFVRGDCSGDGSNNIADAIYLLGNLFPVGGPPTILTCLDACDANDDGGRNIADAVVLLGSLFGMPASPLPPPNSCGVDPSPQDPFDCATPTGNCP